MSDDQTMPDLDVVGWQGREIPLEIQALVIAKKFRAAVSMAAANVHRLHQTVEELFADDPDAGLVMDRLQKHPFFQRTMNKLVDSHDEFTDRSFRLTARNLFDESRDELEDMIVWMSIGLWVLDGAEFPEGIMDDEADEPISMEKLLDEEE